MMEDNLFRGDILLSDPSIIGDASFSRSLIFLTEYDENGAVGFILNKKLDVTLDQLIPDFNVPIPIYSGGPVETNCLYFLHSCPKLIPQSHHIKDNIYWGGNFETVRDLIESGDICALNDIRFFLGYSGWEQEQLQDELKASAWYKLKNNSFESLIEYRNNQTWKNKMKMLGGKYRFWSNAPENPSLN